MVQDKPKPEPADEAQATWDDAERQASYLEELAGMPPFEYAQHRKSAAKRLGVTALALDKEVERLREIAFEEAEEQEQRARFKPVEPWEEEVAGPALMADLVGEFNAYCILPEHADVAIALWALHSYVHDAFHICPRLQLCSPAHRSGKSTVLDVLQLIAHKPLRADHLTMAVVFRLVDRDRPTLLIDDAHRYLKRNDELQGVLGSGHRRGGMIYRVEGEGREVRDYSTWGPVAIALIGKLPPELNDRSITIPMLRKYVHQRVKHLRPGVDPFINLRRRIARWGIDNMQALVGARPTTLKSLHDRARDNWRPLFAIADQLGGEWSQRARDAATSLEAYAEEDDADGIMLLEDIRTFLQREEAEAFTSKQLIDWLVALDHRPWAEYGYHEKQITPHAIAKLLKPFRIVPPKKPKVWIDGKEVRGYNAKWFKDAFERYLP